VELGKRGIGGWLGGQGRGDEERREKEDTS
jgi:hypothetical protein